MRFPFFLLQSVGSSIHPRSVRLRWHWPRRVPSHIPPFRTQPQIKIGHKKEKTLSSPPTPHTATPTTEKNASGTQGMDNRSGSHTSQTRAIEATGHLYSSPSSLRSRKQNGAFALFFSRGKRGFCCPSSNANLLPRIACHFPGCEKTTPKRGSKDASPTHCGRGGERRTEEGRKRRIRRYRLRSYY